MYNHRLYKFKQTYMGEWDSSKVWEITVGSQLSGSISDIKVLAYNTIPAETGKLASSMADLFSDSTPYAVGDVVAYQNRLYKFNTAHAAGAWVGTDADLVTVEDIIADSVEGLVDSSVIAPTFNTSTPYEAGDYVIYNDTFYKFTVDHAAGAWTGSDVTAVSVADEINALKSTESTVESKVETLTNNFADDFDTTESYKVGDVVMKDGVMYKFNTAHAAGAWTGTDVDEIQATDLEPEPLTSDQIAALEALL